MEVKIDKRMETYEFWVNEDYDMTQIKDSMQIDSNECIASLTAGDVTLSLEVVGEVKVFWNENGDPGDGDYYTRPSEFPDKLKDLIAGKMTICRKDGDTEGIEHRWELDDRVYVSENNWFEIFMRDPDNRYGGSASWTVDAEGGTPGELLDLLLGVLDEITKKTA